MADDKQAMDDLEFASEERLRHEVDYLRGRIINLEVFKGMFFTLQEDLVVERSKNSKNQSQSNLPNSDEVSAKINSLTQELEAANEMAMLSITTAGEYSAIIEFFRNSGSVNSYDEMVDLLFSSISSYGVKVSAEVRCYAGENIYCLDPLIKEEHSSLLKRFKIKGRLVEEESVVCINHENISLLICELPEADRDKCGRIKDNVMVLASGANSVIDTIDAKNKLASERKKLYTIVKSTHHAMVHVVQDRNSQLSKMDKVQHSFASKVLDIIDDFELLESHKKKIHDLIDSGEKKLSKILKTTFMLDDKFMEIIAKLEKTYAVFEQASFPQGGNKKLETKK